MNNGIRTEELRENKNGITVYMKEYRNPYILTPHLHTEYEIYYNISGGKGFFIDEHYYECNPHDLFIIRKLHINQFQ